MAIGRLSWAHAPCPTAPKTPLLGLATLGRKLEPEDKQRILDGAYERIGKPAPPPGLMERLREGL